MRVVRCGVSSLELRGGTDADMAPPVAYLTDVVAPLLNRLLGLQLQVRAASGPHGMDGEGEGGLLVGPDIMTTT